MKIGKFIDLPTTKQTKQHTSFKSNQTHLPSTFKLYIKMLETYIWASPPPHYYSFHTFSIGSAESHTKFQKSNSRDILSVSYPVVKYRRVRVILAFKNFDRKSEKLSIRQLLHNVRGNTIRMGLFNFFFPHMLHRICDIM